MPKIVVQAYDGIVPGKRVHIIRVGRTKIKGGRIVEAGRGYEVVYQRRALGTYTDLTSAIERLIKETKI